MTVQIFDSEAENSSTEEESIENSESESSGQEVDEEHINPTV